MKRFSARLYVSPQYKINDEIELAIEFINKTSQPVFISKDLSSAFSFGEKKQPPAFKEKGKGRKTTPSFFTLAANSAILKKINLGKQVGLTPGTHTILFNPASLSIQPDKKGKSKARQPLYKLKALQANIIVDGKKKTTKVVALEGFDVSNLLDHPRTLRLTEPVLLTRSWPEGLVPPRICRVVGGTLQQQDLMRTAHEDGYLLAVTALSGLANDNHYKTWFGVMNDARFRKVREVFRHIVDNFRHDTFTYDLSGTACTDETIGHTNFGSRTIFFCKSFWDLLPTGRSSKAGRVVHEHSHTSADTLDAVFDFNDCLNRARNFPDQAIKNASNYQFFAEG